MKSILSLLLIVLGISIASAQSDFYTNSKFSFGNVGTMSQSIGDSVLSGYYYYCSPLYRTDKEYSPVPLIQSTGKDEREIRPGEFVPYLNEYIESTFSDKPGDTIMIICDGDKNWAFINSIGIYNDMCMGLIPICQLMPIGKRPPAVTTSFSNNIIVLRKGAYYTGEISEVIESTTASPIDKHYIDSLKTVFSKLNADSQFPDFNAVKSYVADGPAKIVFVACYRFRNRAMYFSALYGIVSDSGHSIVLTLLGPAAVGHREWKFHSVVDFDKDGLPEYFVSVLGWNNEAVGIFTIKKGEWIQMQNAFYNGCVFED